MVNLKIGNATYKFGADLDWVRNDLAVGGELDSIAMADARRQGITHILNVSRDDDTKLAGRYGIDVLWLPTDDDLDVKPAAWFKVGVEFAHRILVEPKSRLLVHCAAGIHRSVMMVLAILGSFGWKLESAQRLMKARRPCVDFPPEYLASVQHFLDGKSGAPPAPPQSRFDWDSIAFTDHGVKDGVLRITAELKAKDMEAYT